METFHFLDLADGPRFAIVSHPDGRWSGTGVLLCSGGWHPGSWNRNRMYVRLARALTAKGHRVVRFDWYGTGESPGFIERFRLKEPRVDDVIRAASLLRGCDRVFGAGICFGAVSLLAAAGEIDHLRGIVLASARFPGGRPKVRARDLSMGTAIRAGLRPSMAKGWFDPHLRRLFIKWLRMRGRALIRRFRQSNGESPGLRPMAAHVEKLARRNVSMCFLYSQGDPHVAAFSRKPLASVTASPNVRVEVSPLDLDGWSTIEAQEVAIRAICEMVETGNSR